ncbi:MAG: signal peptide peptidase SppA [Planctomycetia bacterium]|nr:signal peptide peptidase SppA [Planctomycetia bacterium]
MRAAFRLIFGIVPIILVLLLLLVVASFLFGSPDGVQERSFQDHRFEGTTHKIAVIRVEGPLLTSEGYIKRQIDQVVEDEDVKAVVLRVNSPGGLVSATDDLYHQLLEMRKSRGKGQDIPIVVSMGGIAASGGYYLSMAVGDAPNAIFVEPVTWTGSIGVIIPHYDASGLLKEWSVKENSIVSHRLKGMGSLTREMTDEERAILQGLVDDSFTRFKAVVQTGRPKMNAQQIDQVATGQVFTARQALAAGLADKEGYIEDAIDRVIELARQKDASLKADDFGAVEYRSPFTLVDLVVAQASSDEPKLSVEALLDLTTPRAYYICTWLPGVTPTK